MTSRYTTFAWNVANAGNEWLLTNFAKCIEEVGEEAPESALLESSVINEVHIYNQRLTIELRKTEATWVAGGSRQWIVVRLSRLVANL